MNKRRVQVTIKDLLSQASSVSTGLTEHGAALQLKYGTASGINTARTGVINSNAAVETAEEELRELFRTLASARKEARKFSTLFRENMKGVFGERYSTDWNSVGFYGSLRIPDQTEDLELLMERLQAFFTANATSEINNRQLTAARAKEIGDLIRDTRTNIESKKTALKNLIIARQGTVTALREKILETVRELEIALGKMDARWLSFGLRIPGMPRTPEVPTGVTAILVGPTAASVKWNKAARAKYYRVAKRVIGVDTELVPVGIPADIDFTLEGLPLNSVVEVAVAAANEAGVSAYSEVTTVSTQ